MAGDGCLEVWIIPRAGNLGRAIFIALQSVDNILGILDAWQLVTDMGSDSLEHEIRFFFFQETSFIEEHGKILVTLIELIVEIEFILVECIPDGFTDGVMDGIHSFIGIWEEAWELLEEVFWRKFLDEREVAFGIRDSSSFQIELLDDIALHILDITRKILAIESVHQGLFGEIICTVIDDLDGIVGEQRDGFYVLFRFHVGFLLSGSRRLSLQKG